MAKDVLEHRIKLKKSEPPRPYVFTTREELLAVIGSKTNLDAVAALVATTNGDIAELVRKSVGSNTFRAFHIKRYGLSPSDLYRGWVTQRLTEQASEFASVNTIADMRKLLVGTARDLRKHWLEKTRGEHDIKFGRSAKLLNLSFKFMLCFESIRRERAEELMKLLDVPLDSYTLQGVREVLPDLRIPANATMNHVEDEARYVEVQDAIREMCGPSLFPIHYEYASWNLAHPSVKLL